MMTTRPECLVGHVVLDIELYRLDERLLVLPMQDRLETMPRCLEVYESVSPSHSQPVD